MAINVKRPQQTVEFIEDATLAQAHEDAVAELQRLVRDDHKAERFVDPERKAAAERVKAVEAEAEKSILVFTLQAVGRKRYNELVAEHPAREGNDADQAVGVNQDTFFDALIGECILRVNRKHDNSVEDFDPRKEWSALADEMTDGQYAEFVTAAQELNRGMVRAPFPSRLASAIRESDEISS